MTGDHPAKRCHAAAATALPHLMLVEATKSEKGSSISGSSSPRCAILRSCFMRFFLWLCVTMCGIGGDVCVVCVCVGATASGERGTASGTRQQRCQRAPLAPPPAHTHRDTPRTPAEGELLLVAPQHAGPRLDRRLAQHVVQVDHLACVVVVHRAACGTSTDSCSLSPGCVAAQCCVGALFAGQPFSRPPTHPRHATPHPHMN
jgi:hypothetical protein